MLLMSVSDKSFLEKGVNNIMSYLCSHRKMIAVKILPVKIVCDGKLIELS